MKVLRAKYLLIIGLIAVFFSSSSAAGPKLPQRVSIKSLKQTVTDKNIFLFETQVELLIDERLHVWADQVTYDNQSHIIRANALSPSLVIIEDNDVVLCAQSLEFDLQVGTGSAQCTTMQLKEGFVYASRARRGVDGQWLVEEAVYTPCDHFEPHWRIALQQARVTPTMFFGKNLVFYIGSVPLMLLPRILFPTQNKAKSGLLMPQVSFDFELGPGWRQDYYWLINKHADATFGIDWKHSRGFFGTHKARWASGPEKYGFYTGYYGFEEHAFGQRQDAIVPLRQRERYWLQGNYFYADGDLHLLTQVDHGTDKKTGYRFFDSLDGVDDYFYNAAVARSYHAFSMLDLRADYTKTSRKRFSFAMAPIDENNLVVAPGASSGTIRTERLMQELDNQVGVAHLAHTEVSSLYRYFERAFSYRQDVLFDQVLLREQETEKLFFQSKLAQQARIVPLRAADYLRFEYAGCLQEYLPVRGLMLSLSFKPHLSGRSLLADANARSRKNALEERLFARGAVRFFCEAAASLNFPEACVTAGDGYAHYFQPILSWSLVPSMRQAHWYYADQWDRWYAKNQVEFSLRNNWEFGEVALDCYVSQGYDFYAQQGRFYLQRGIEPGNILPFNIHVDALHPMGTLFIASDIDLKAGTMLQGRLGINAQFGRAASSISYLYQDSTANRERGLLSNIPHFLVCDFQVPLNKYARLDVGGHFYAEKRPAYRLRPLLSYIKFLYQGHCWAFSVGFEAKHYREYGQGKHEHAIIFSLQFDSLGSFAKKIKTPYVTNS